jgi:signal peptidase I
VTSVERPDPQAPARPSGGGPASASGGPRPVRRLLLRVGVLLVALAVLLVLRETVATPVRISSASMEPTLGVGNVVLVSQQPPGLEDLDHGDLVTFTSPEDGRRTVKRVVGLPGDSVVIKDSVLYVNDRVVDEPYVDHAAIDAYYSRTYTVPDGKVFLLGDNRGNSIDSRDYGAVPAGDLLGRVLLRLWPVVRFHAPQPTPPQP